MSRIEAHTGKLLIITDYSLILKNAEEQRFPVLEHISLELERGQCLGLAGESGSGKSILALGIMGLIPPGSIIEQKGSILFDTQELTRLPENHLRALRGRRIAMVFQEPMTAMNPLMTLFKQIAEVVQAHEPTIAGEALEKRVNTALKSAGFPDPRAFYDSFPHQLSGGMRQRAMLAMTLVMEPDLIIADEPTTALDAALQVQLLGELRTLVKVRGHSMLFISHDLGVIKAIADHLAVLYAGNLMETGPAGAILSNPGHPYTHALVAAMPRLVQDRKLPLPIPGHLPSPDRKPSGCVFSDRCPRVKDHCRSVPPPPQPVGENHFVRCYYPITA